MNTDKTNGLSNLSLIRDNPCNPWLNKNEPLNSPQRHKGHKEIIHILPAFAPFVPLW
jgi:hypothetical protein